MGNNENRKIYKSFDSLKGICVILAVTLSHYWQFTGAEYWFGGDIPWQTNLANAIQHFAFLTFALMELLFLISGVQMFHYYKKISSGSISFNDYIVGRIKRLFPIAIVSTIAFVIGQMIHESLYEELWHGYDVNAGAFVRCCLCIQTWLSRGHSLNGPLWYISVYFLCLVLLYPLVRLGEKTGLKQWTLWIPIILGIYIYGNSEIDLFCYNEHIARGYVAFFTGILFAYYTENLSKKASNILTVYSTVAIITTLIIRIVNPDYLFARGNMHQAFFFILFFFLPLIHLITTYKWVDMVIGCKPLYWLGKISLYIYVINFPFYVWLRVFEKWTETEIDYTLPGTYFGTTIAQIVIAYILSILMDGKKVKAIASRLKTAMAYTEDNNTKPATRPVSRPAQAQVTNKKKEPSKKKAPVVKDYSDDPDLY